MHSNYDIALVLDPSTQRLTAQVHLSWYISQAIGQLEFLLHRDLPVTTIGGHGVTSYRREPKAYAFSPEAVTWVVELEKVYPAGSRLDLEFQYGGAFTGPFPEAWQVNRLTPDWVELGMYGPWFPWNPQAGPFTYTVRTEIDAKYILVGLGQTERSKDYWLVSSAKPVEDIVLTAAPSLDCCTREKGNASVDVWYSQPEDAACAELMGNDGVWALDFYRQWLGDVPGRNELTVVVARRSFGGGYSRPGLIVLPALDGERQGKSFIGHVAHELAHFWWNGAAMDCWEDWLNEAFAEYSALKAMAARRGDDVDLRLLAQKREGMEGLPPIRGLERRDEQAYAVLYDKGPVLLHELEQSIGEDKFTRLLRERLVRGVNTTDGFLALLRELTDAKTAAAFSRRLDQ